MDGERWEICAQIKWIRNTMNRILAGGKRGGGKIIQRKLR